MSAFMEAWSYLMYSWQQCLYTVDHLQIVPNVPFSAFVIACLLMSVIFRRIFNK